VGFRQGRGAAFCRRRHPQAVCDIPLAWFEFAHSIAIGEAEAGAQSGAILARGFMLCARIDFLSGNNNYGIYLLRPH